MREPHVMIQSPLRKEAIVCSLFCYLTVLHDNDEVCYTLCEHLFERLIRRKRPTDTYLLEQLSSACHSSHGQS